MNKIEKSELDEILSLQEKLSDQTQEIGVLEAKKHGLLHMLAKTNSDVLELRQNLELKYGAVNINLEDGSYKEIEEEKQDLKVVKHL